MSFKPLHVVDTFGAWDKNATVLQGAEAESQRLRRLGVGVNRNMRFAIVSAPYVVHYQGANWDAAKMV